MRGIKHLPKAVHSSLHSSVILFDLTRVIEDLVFNSLDAGATKVIVYVNIGACFFKVEDDGCGISRDALTLLGEEKFASSKVQCVDDRGTDIECLGFRGVTLGSLSDISLLEVLTRARGKPNGYRKIIKGCKCLFLGVDDHRQEAGTTVIVRELFYNQPVRRKCMQSSPKKVLHSVKKCILQTAFVFPHVSFKVIDTDSDTELLCTIPSSSPLPLLASCFGTEVSSSLQEVNFSDGLSKLYGYLSCPGDAFPTKTFQYVYINSRIVCNGPIHKLLNSMAAQLEYSLALRKGKLVQNRRKQKLQANIAYILDLCCPQSSYDLTFEPSKTRVDFKDWSCTLSFIEQAVRHIWGPMPTYLLQEEVHAQKDGVPRKGEMWKGNGNSTSSLQDLFTADLSSCCINKKIDQIQHHEISMDLSLNVCPPKISSSEVDLLSCRRKLKRLPVASHAIQLPEVDLLSHEGKSKTSSRRLEGWDSSAQSSAVFNPKRSISVRDDVDFFHGQDYFWSRGHRLRWASEDNEEDSLLGSRWRNKSPQVNRKMWEGSTWNTVKQSDFDSEVDTRKFLFPSSQAKRAKKDSIENLHSTLFSNHKGFEINFDDSRNQKQLVSPDDIIDILENDHRDGSSSFFTMNLPVAHSFMRKCQTSMEVNVKSTDFSNSCVGEFICFSRGSGHPQCSLAEVGEKVSDHQRKNSNSCFLLSNDDSDTTFCTVDDFSGGYAMERNFFPQEAICSGCFEPEEKDDLFSHSTRLHSSKKEECSTSSSIKTEMGYEKCFGHRWKFNDCSWNGFASDDIIFEELGPTGELYKEQDHLCDELQDTMNKRTSGNIFLSMYRRMRESRRCEIGDQHHEECCNPVVRTRRSCSAPPFFRGKSKFSLLYSHVKTADGGETNVQFLYNDTLPVTVCEDSSASCAPSQPDHKTMSVNSPMCPRECLDEKCYDIPNSGRMQESAGFGESQNICFCPPDALKEIVPSKLGDSEVNLTKWRDGSAHAKVGDKLNNPPHEDGVLDISSGLLHLSGGSLVPESIHKDFLDSANILLQLDKKFIPVVAGGILAIIDQHAADERIRLEELHKKVLSGEERTIAYLDSKQELVLPEFGLQLLQNYAEQIQDWGWICNIYSQGSASFSKDMNLLHRQPFVVTLAAVPCVLGIKLSDKDLVEFLQQLADTDGSSTTPPAVLRILNFKACRGAIMFGDSLLPAECSLIVDELKATSLCFQCAHGRPTTVPVVNLDALHKQLKKLSLQNDGPTEEWHGLRRHKPSLERAKTRFASACKQ